MSVYLDWNATTPRHPAVRAEMDAAEELVWANPSSTHAAGRRARRSMEETRELLAGLLGSHPRDVVFTGGGTEANHLALSGTRYLVTSRLEHPSVALEAERLAEQETRVVFCDVGPQGVVTPDAVDQGLESMLGERRGARPDGSRPHSNADTPLVAVMAANHETGVLQPIEAIAEVAHSWGARLHVDAVQLLGRGELSGLGAADSIAIAGHKIRGPKGVGALVFRPGFTPMSRGRGGAQERGLRPGTQDAVTLAGFRAALARVPESGAAYRSLAQLRDSLESHLMAQLGHRIRFHGRASSRLHHVTNFAIEGWRGDELVAALDLEGICVSSGSACSAGTAEASPVISAMHDRAAGYGAVRVSLGEASTQADVEALLAALHRLGVVANPKLEPSLQG